MTNWLPDLAQGTGPLYARLANSIEHAIETGALSPGEKLPPLRNLAFDIGVTVGTVSRAYGVARERGLVSGEVGRGTYVLENEPSSIDNPAAGISAAVPAGTRAQAASDGSILLCSTAAPDVGQGKVISDLTARLAAEKQREVIDYIHVIPDSWREAGSRWLGRNTWMPAPDRIVPTQGAHAALLSVIATTTQPGDRIVMDELSYASVARSAAILGRRIITTRLGTEGTDPDEFERVCARQHPKLAFLLPSFHNPTVVNMPESCRQRIAESARRHNVWLMEDAVYGALNQSSTPHFAELAPERTFLVGSLSKSVAAGVRGGWVACPPNMATRIATAHKLISGGKPFLMADLAAQLVLLGQADRIRGQVQDDIARREAMAQQIFEGYRFRCSPHCPFLWMALPEPWQSTAFRLAAAEEGVLVDDEDEFKPARTDQTHHHVRIGFSVPTREDMQHGFSLLRDLLDRGPVTHDSYA